MWPFKPRNRIMLEKEWVNVDSTLRPSKAVKIGQQYYAHWIDELIRLNEDGTTNCERLLWTPIDPVSEWR